MRWDGCGDGLRLIGTDNTSNFADSERGQTSLRGAACVGGGGGGAGGLRPRPGDCSGATFRNGDVMNAYVADQIDRVVFHPFRIVCRIRIHEGLRSCMTCLFFVRLQ